MHRRSLRLLPWLLIAPAFACGSSSETTGSGGASSSAASSSTGPGETCFAGEQIGCRCTDGRAGAQTCRADGKGYDPCVCTDGSSSSVGPGGAGGAGGGSVSSSTTSSSAGGGNAVCVPGSIAACAYTGPIGTEDVGACHAATKVCAADGSSYGACSGEVLPAVEDCATPADEACDAEIAPCGASTLWAKRFGDAAAYQGASGLVLDDAAEPIISGSLQGTMDFGGGPLSAPPTGAFYLAKFSPDGAPLWSKPVSGQFLEPKLAVDGLGRVTGVTSVQGLANFGAGPVPGSDEWRDLAAAQFDASGALLWAHRWIGTNNTDPLAVTSDPQGNVYFGVYGGAAGLDLGCGPIASPSPAAGFGGFAAKLSPNGACLWSQGISGNTQIQAMARDPSGRLFVLALFIGDADFGGMLVTGSSGGAGNTAFAAYDAAGTLLYTRVFPGTFVETAAMTILPDGDVLVGAHEMHGYPIDFGTGPVTGGNILAAFGAADATTHWAVGVGQGSATVDDVAIDTNGDLVVSGAYLADSTIGTTQLTGSGVYLAHYDGSGNAIGVRGFGGYALGTLLRVDGQANVVLAGSLFGSIAFPSNTLTSAGQDDAFLADVGP